MQWPHHRYVLLDVIFNHTGDNFFYKHEGKMVSTMPYRDHHKHPFGAWKDEHGKRTRLPLNTRTHCTQCRHRLR
jgi:glycosidase